MNPELLVSLYLGSVGSNANLWESKSPANRASPTSTATDPFLPVTFPTSSSSSLSICRAALPRVIFFAARRALRDFFLERGRPSSSNVFTLAVEFLPEFFLPPPNPSNTASSSIISSSRSAFSFSNSGLFRSDNSRRFLSFFDSFLFSLKTSSEPSFKFFDFFAVASPISSPESSSRSKSISSSPPSKKSSSKPPPEPSFFVSISTSSRRTFSCNFFSLAFPSRFALFSARCFSQTVSPFPPDFLFLISSFRSFIRTLNSSSPE
mmetsp:Transcript_7183/g.27068  ORF Transcript_7183/g.27068 Transcript_7183/m.27068 type:complete len:264 (+) Transcript_7183:507-1298(+)